MIFDHKVLCISDPFSTNGLPKNILQLDNEKDGLNPEARGVPTSTAAVTKTCLWLVIVAHAEPDQVTEAAWNR